MGEKIKANIIGYSLGWSVATMPTLATKAILSKRMKSPLLVNLITAGVFLGCTITFGNTIKKSLLKNNS